VKLFSFLRRSGKRSHSGAWALLLAGSAVTGFAQTNSNASPDVAAVPAREAVAPRGLMSPEHQLNDPSGDPAWRDLFAQLAPNRTRQSSFEERRYFPFRREPVVLRGEIRLVPERGLSLRYLEPEPHVMIVDAQGVLMRGPDGRERTPPNDARAQAASSALVKILRFDVAALQRDFLVYGRRDGASWSMAFAPRDATLANLIGSVLVTGEAGIVATIEMIKSPTQRIEITLRDTRENLIFTGDTLRRFFR
jgi:hypothetical protein